MKRLLSPVNSGYELSPRGVIYSRTRVNIITNRHQDDEK